MDRPTKTRPVPVLSMSSYVLQTAENKGRLERDNELLRADLEKAKKSALNWKNKYLSLRELLNRKGVRIEEDRSQDSVFGLNSSHSVSFTNKLVERCINCYDSSSTETPTCGENRIHLPLSMGLLNHPEHQALLKKFNDLLKLVRGIHVYFDQETIPNSLHSYLKSDIKHNLKVNGSVWSGECLDGAPHGKGTLTDEKSGSVEEVVLINEARIGESITTAKYGPKEVRVHASYDHQGNKHGPYKKVEKQGLQTLLYEEGVFKSDQLVGPGYEKSSSPDQSYTRFYFRSEAQKYSEVILNSDQTELSYREEENDTLIEHHFVRIDQLDKMVALLQNPIL